MKKVLFACVFLVVVILIAVHFVPAEPVPYEQPARVIPHKSTEFVQYEPHVVCNNGFPNVTLSWTVFPDTSVYNIQRNIDPKVEWSEILDTVSNVNTSYIDTLWHSDYGAVEYRYRIVAVSGKRKIMSNEMTVQVPECRNGVASTTVATTTASTPKPIVIATTTTPVPVPSVKVVEGKMPKGVSWGAFVGWHESAMSDFESLVGKSPSMEMVFSHWGNDADFPVIYTKRIKDKGRTMILFWEAVDYNTDYTKQPQFSFDAVLSGSLDAYFKRFAKGAKAYGGPVVLIPYSEFNGNWYPWSGTVGSNTPQKYIDSYRYLRSFFKDVPNVKFAWVVNGVSVPNVPANDIGLYYPGDAYVDYVGVDGFNMGGSAELSFNDSFSSTLEKLKTYNKPMYIYSMASAESETKAHWIINALTVELYKYPEIKGWLWFNEKKERDWRVNSSPSALSAFKQAIP